MFSTDSHNPNKDLELPQPPGDGISSVVFSPRANYLVAGSWDNSVRCWEIQASSNMSYNAVPKTMYNHDGPVLCTCWSGDGTKVFIGGCDNKVKCWSLASNTSSICAQHAAPVKVVGYMDDPGILVTGSWDKTLKYWDGRTQAPAATINLPERVYAMGFLPPLAVVGTAERHVLIYDLRKPTVEFKKLPSPLKYQTRCISCFPDRTGFALGSIEGRVAVHYVEDRDSSKNFAFKCHRDSNNNNVYSVNDISFHPTYGTFATVGSDGTFNFWDKDSKQRLKPFAKLPQPIPCSNFNMDGKLFAYASSYDWSKGAEYYKSQAEKNYIFVHPVSDGEIKPRR